MAGATRRETLPRAGERRTEQRRAIRDVLQDAARPLGMHEILKAAQRRVPALGLATVYRNVKRLLDEGWLSPVQLPGEPDRYEPLGMGHHHHFHCDDCGRLFDVSACAREVHRLAPSGFEVLRHEVLLYGRCSDCVSRV